MNSESETPDSEEATSEWNVLTCPHCEGKFKVGANSTESQMACPHCNEIVSLKSDDSDSGPKPIKSRPVTAYDDESRIPVGLKNTEDLVKQKPLPDDWDPEKEAAPDRKKKVRSGSGEKKAKIAWETEERDDEENEDLITEYYTGDPDDPEGIRIKRIRKKKKLTPTQKLIRNIVIGAVSIGVIVTGVVIATTFIKQVNLAANTEAMQQLPQPEKDLAAMIRSGEIVPPNPTEDEHATCLDIIQKFIAAKTVDERVALVRTPERVRPILESIHPKHGLDPFIGAEHIIFSRKDVENERYFIHMAVSSKEDKSEVNAKNTHFASFEQDDGKILLDWEITSKYQKMSFLDFVANPPKAPTMFRVKVQPSDLLAAPYDDPEKYQSVVLTYPGDPLFRMIGFFDKESDWGLKFSARLEFEAPSIVADIRFVDRLPEPFVEITKIHSNSWFLD